MCAPAPPQEGADFAVVLVRPKGAGNIGSIARSMAHFGLSRLRLVAPHGDAKSLEARAMAMNAQPLLDAAEHFATLREATRDCGWLVATSRRLGRRRLPTMLPREGAPLLLSRAGQTRVALVFGPEDRGLRTDEVDLCQERLLIPALPGGDSFNLAQAALVVFWEIFMAKATSLGEGPPPGAEARLPASREEVEGLVDHLMATLEEIGYLAHNDPDRVARASRRLLDRAQPDDREVQMMRGVLRQLSWKSQRALSEE